MSNEDNYQTRAMTAIVSHSTTMTAKISHEQEETDVIDEDAYLALQKITTLDVRTMCKCKIRVGNNKQRTTIGQDHSNCPT
jgi:hypothetical protein